MTEPDREHISRQVVGAKLTWHERSIRRRDEEVEKTRSMTIEIDVKVDTQEARDDKPPSIAVRQRAHASEITLEATYDVTVFFRLQKDFPVNDENSVRDFVRLVGFDYVLGFVRGAFADGARSVGLQPPLIPTFDPDVEDLTKHDGVDGATRYE